MRPNFNRGDRLVKKQILSLNKHLPRQRKFLDELLQEERPHVLGADGTRHRFKKDELKKLAEILEETEHHMLKLPIYIEIDSNASGSRSLEDSKPKSYAVYLKLRIAVLKYIYTERTLKC